MGATLRARYLFSQEPMFLFLGSALAFIFWRWSDFFVWDDTSSAGFNQYSNGGHFALDRLSTIVKESFAYVQVDGYRPISAIIRGIGAAYVLANGLHPAIFIIANGFLCGLVVVLLRRFAAEFLEQAALSYFACFLFLASTPVLTGSLVLFSGIQFLVFVFLLGSLNVYFLYEERGGRRLLSALLLLLIIGPWVREFVGLAGALILVNELLHRRQIGALTLVAAIGFLHALFPTFVVSFLYPDLPLTPVFRMGNLANFIAPEPGGETIWAVIAGLHWRIFLDLFSILPPSLVLTGMLVCIYRLSFDRSHSIKQSRRELFLLIFFAVSFLPFLKIFNSQVHLAYCLLPLSVLLAAQIEYLWRLKPAVQWSLRPIVCAVIIVAAFDHTLNIYAVRHVTTDIYGTISSLARWFEREVPRGTVVISNAHHLEDIRLYSRGHIDPWAAVGGIPDKSRWLNEPKDYVRFFDPNFGRAVVLLDVRKPKLTGQRGRERVFREVQHPIFNMEMIGKIRTVSSRYFFFDPFRFLLPTRVTNWVGPPDLEFDFYRGPSLKKMPFRREVAVDYYLYRMTGDHVWQWAPHPVLLKQSYFGFNIVGFRDRVYAIPQTEGAFELTRVLSGGYSRSFAGDDLESVTSAIDNSISANERKILQSKPLQGK